MLKPANTLSSPQALYDQATVTFKGLQIDGAGLNAGIFFTSVGSKGSRFEFEASALSA